MENNPTGAHKYIFIGGLHRSGTWLQTRSFENHPEISRLGSVNNTAEGGDFSKYEGQFLQSVYPDDDYYGGVGRLGFHPEVHLTEQSPLVTEDNRNRLKNEWNRYWDTTRICLLEKTPANILRTRFLQAMFPDSRFILVMRHPVAVALAQQKWTGTSLSSLVEHWLVCYESLVQDVEYLDRYLFTRYEDFIETPMEHTRLAYSFLGLDPVDVIDNIRRDGNERYFNIWENAINKKINRKSVSHRVVMRVMPYALRYGYPLTILENEIDMILTRFEERAMRFGYSLKDVRKLAAPGFNIRRS